MKNLLITLALLTTGCASTSSVSSIQHTESPVKYTDTMAIIEAAAEHAPYAVSGVYTLKIVATGKQGEFVYLNTEDDYRDPRAVTVALHPKVLSRLKSKFEESPQAFFLNKSIEVTGKAKRTKIRFFANGKPTDKYYYQTHIRVMDASQIKIVG